MGPKNQLQLVLCVGSLPEQSNYDLSGQHPLESAFSDADHALMFWVFKSAFQTAFVSAPASTDVFAAAAVHCTSSTLVLRNCCKV